MRSADTNPGLAVPGGGATWLAAIGVGCAYGAATFLPLAADGPPLRHLSGLVGWALPRGVPFGAAALGLGLSESLARHSPRWRDAALFAGGALSPLGAALLASKLLHLREDGLDPVPSMGRVADFLLSHPAEALLVALACGAAWTLVGGLRLVAPGQRATQLALGLGLGVALVALCDALWLVRAESAFGKAIAVHLPLTLVAFGLVERLLQSTPHQAAASGSWLRRRAALAGCALGCAVLAWQVPGVRAAWHGHTLRQPHADYHLDSEIRGRAVVQLSQLGDAGLAQLVGVLARPPSEIPYLVRSQAARALGELGDPRAVPHLLKALRWEQVDHEIKNAIVKLGVAPVHYPLFAKAVEARLYHGYVTLVRTGRTEPRELAPFLLQLARDVPLVGQKVAWDLARLPRDQAVPALEAMASQSPPNRFVNPAARRLLRELLANPPTE